jgi:hypothetical protein
MTRRRRRIRDLVDRDPSHSSATPPRTDRPSMGRGGRGSGWRRAPAGRRGRSGHPGQVRPPSRQSQSRGSRQRKEPSGDAPPSCADPTGSYRDGRPDERSRDGAGDDGDLEVEQPVVERDRSIRRARPDQDGDPEQDTHPRAPDRIQPAAARPRRARVPRPVRPWTRRTSQAGPPVAIRSAAHTSASGTAMSARPMLQSMTRAPVWRF